MLEAAFLFITATCLVSSVAAVILRRKSYLALLALFNADGDAIEPARQKYWKSETTFKIPAIVTMACYAVMMLTVIIFKVEHMVMVSPSYFLAAFFAASVGLVTIGAAASHYNQKEALARIDDLIVKSRRDQRDDQAPVGPRPPESWD